MRGPQGEIGERKGSTVGIPTLENELKELVMLYVAGDLEEKRFLAAYRLVRLQALLRRP